MHWISIIAAIGLWAQWTSAGQPEIVSEAVLWKMGDDGVPSYRIPIVSYTPKGNLIAIAEARRQDSSDIGPKYFVIRRSTDLGNTWSKSEIFLTDDSPDAMNLGTVVVDDVTGVMHMITVKCAHYWKCKTAETYHMRSEDDGKTWSSPRILNRYLGDKMFAPGPGVGFQKKHFPHKGRLVVCGHSTLYGNGAFLLVSDDHGVTWSYGGNIKSIPYEQPKRGGDFSPDECLAFEADDGSIVVNIRNQDHYHCRCRMVARSYDGGDSLDIETLYFDESLLDSAVSAGGNIQNGIFFFSNPHHSTSRVNMQLKWSYNEGKNWEKNPVVVFSQKAGYSVISVSPADKKHLFLVLERGAVTDIDELVFHRIDVSSLGSADRANSTDLPQGAPFVFV